jgi:hypothetical protein
MNSRKDCKRVCASILLVLVALVLGGSKASAQTKKPAAPAAPVKTAPTPKVALPGKGTGAGGVMGHPTSPANHGGPTTTPAHGVTTSNPGHLNTNSGAHPNIPNGGVGAGGRHEMSTRSATPRGVTTMHTPNGEVHMRADGKPRDVHVANRGMDIHHGLDGHRRVEMERTDHSRIVAEHGGRGYVQHPYMYRGHEFGHRTYYRNGRVYDHYYGRYYYRGAYVNYYAPAYYYRPAFYGWAYNPWITPVPYAWGWGGNPWCGYYGYYFTPYPVYPGPSAWLTDYMISLSLAAAYQNAAEAAALTQAQGGPPPNAAPLTPEVKDMITAEVQRQIALENEEAKTAQTAVPDPASSSVHRILTDNVQHVFLVGHELDVVNSAGAECAVSQGDALQLVGPPPPESPTASLLVLSSKGGIECRRNDTVSVQIADLQEMQNHMRETIDTGLAELQSKQGSGGLPTIPAAAKGEPVKATFMRDAPPPDPNAAYQLTAEYNAGVTAENQALGGTSQDAPASLNSQPPPIAAPAPAPRQVSMGQSIDEVIAALGQPNTIIDLGAKKIYVYKDAKITFRDNKLVEAK